jgi:hypothetical protein
MRRWASSSSGVDGNEPAHAVIPGKIGLQDPDHCLCVNPVRFGPVATARNKETGWVEDIDVDPARSKQSSKPESIISDFKAQTNGNRNEQPWRERDLQLSQTVSASPSPAVRLASDIFQFLATGMTSHDRLLSSTLT